MSLARHFNRTLRKHLRCQAVWPPATAVAPGDYGVFVGGLWTRVGNITVDFGVPFETEPGGNQLDRFLYHSDTKDVGDVKVGAAMGTMSGELSISLSDRAAFFVSVADFDILRLRSVRKVALALRDRPSWSHLRNYVVWETFHGRDLVFCGSDSGASGLQIRGDMDNVKLFRDTGRLSPELGFTATGDVSVHFHSPPGGRTDFGVNLFRVKAVGADPESLSFGAGDEDDAVEHLDPAAEPTDDAA